MTQHFLDLSGLSLFLDKLKEIFANKDKATNIIFSDTEPNNQDVGDVWFKEV